MIKALLPKVDKLLIGGGMAFTFFKAQGKEIGGSLVEDDRARDGPGAAAQGGRQDRAAGRSPGRDGRLRSRRRARVGASGPLPGTGWGRRTSASTSGEATQAMFTEVVTGARTVVWNGPMGVFEIPSTADGHARHRPGAGGGHRPGRHHRRGRRRHRRGGREERPRGQDDARLDRRRRRRSSSWAARNCPGSRTSARL